jgi:hypothetical protein
VQDQGVTLQFALKTSVQLKFFIVGVTFSTRGGAENSDTSISDSLAQLKNNANYFVLENRWEDGVTAWIA